MIKVEFIYSTECPNAKIAKKELCSALKESKLKAQLIEWNIDDPNTPHNIVSFGSPTILINGKDIYTGKWQGDAECCRIYKIDKEKFSGNLTKEFILKELRYADKKNNNNIRYKKLAVISGAISSLVSLLPVVICPACIPIYGSILTSLGITFLINKENLLLLTLAMLFLSLAFIGYTAKQEKNYIPFILSLIGATLIIIGKFIASNTFATYIGIALLIIATIINYKIKNKPNCAMCHE